MMVNLTCWYLNCAVPRVRARRRLPASNPSAAAAPNPAGITPSAAAAPPCVVSAPAASCCSCSCWLLLSFKEASVCAAAASASAAVGVAASGVPVAGVGGALVLKLRSNTNSLPLRLLCACTQTAHTKGCGKASVCLRVLMGVGCALSGMSRLNTIALPCMAASQRSHSCKCASQDCAARAYLPCAHAICHAAPQLNRSAGAPSAMHHTGSPARCMCKCQTPAPGHLAQTRKPSFVTAACLPPNKACSARLSPARVKAQAKF